MMFSNSSFFRCKNTQLLFIIKNSELEGGERGSRAFVYAAVYFDHAGLFGLIALVRADPTEMYLLHRAKGEKTRSWTDRITETH